jgi:hypothetical protein
MNDARNTASNDPAPDRPVTVGTVVRDRCWGGTYTGTVVRRDGRSVFVAWHGTAVEDQLDVDQVVPWPDAPAELATWRGGVGVLDGDSYRVEPVGGKR